MSDIDLGIAGIEHAVEVGVGGFATVYRANQPAFDRVVAVKVLDVRDMDEGARRRFERECRAMGAIGSHPGIVSVYDAGFSASGRPYLLMPYLRAGSLADRLHRIGVYGWEEATRIGVKLCAALETAHRSGIVHRDIKPANILVSDYGEPQLTDFGIARISGGPETRSGVITASFGHVAPEILGGHPPSTSADVYSLASTLYTMIAGSEPFGRGDDEPLVTLVTRIVTQPVPDLRPRGLPSDLCDVLEQALAKDPDDRPASAAEFGRDLQRVQAAVGMHPTDMLLGAAGNAEDGGLPDPPVRSGQDDPTIAAPEAGSPAGPLEPAIPATDESDLDVAVPESGARTVTDEAQAKVREAHGAAVPVGPEDTAEHPVPETVADESRPTIGSAETEPIAPSPAPAEPPERTAPAEDEGEGDQGSRADQSTSGSDRTEPADPVPAVSPASAAATPPAAAPPSRATRSTTSPPAVTSFPQPERKRRGRLWLLAGGVVALAASATWWFAIRDTSDTPPATADDANRNGSEQADDTPPATADDPDPIETEPPEEEREDDEADRVAAIVAHWDRYSEAWANGEDSGVDFIVAHNMIVGGPRACRVGYRIADSVQADPLSVVRADDWQVPWPDRLARQPDEIYELTIVSDGGEPHPAHIAFVDGQPYHYFGCRPEWLGAWEAIDTDGSRLWTFVDYDAADDQFSVIFLDDRASSGQCAGGPALAIGSTRDMSDGGFVAAIEPWCASPGVDVPPELQFVPDVGSDGGRLLVDLSTGLTFTALDESVELPYDFDIESDALIDAFGVEWVRSERESPGFGDD